MPKQYIEFVTLPGFATIWESMPEGIPADLVAEVDAYALHRFAFPSDRFQAEDVGGGDFQVVDTVEGWEVCMITTHSDLTDETIDKCKVAVVDALNRSAIANALDFECWTGDI